MILLLTNEKKSFVYRPMQKLNLLTIEKGSFTNQWKKLQFPTNDNGSFID